MSEEQYAFCDDLDKLGLFTGSKGASLAIVECRADYGGHPLSSVSVVFANSLCKLTNLVPAVVSQKLYHREQIRNLQIL